MFYPVKIICYFAIASSVGFQFSACISLTQDEYNIITNKPLRLLCDVEIPITTQVTIRSPDNVAVVTCTGAVLSPPAPAGCTSAAGYTGSINETAYTVTVTTNNLPANVNGTWKCTHNSIDATIIFPNPVPCFTTESFTQSSFTGNQTIDTAAISLTATYSCINVDVTFRWILTASTSHEVSSTSTSVSKDSSTCTDSGTCTGVNAYTQIISSDSIFGFATTNGLQGLYVLSVEAHYTNGITALQSQSIGNFIFSQSKDSCDCNYWKCIGIILAVVIAFSLVCTVMLVWKRKVIQLKAKLIVCCCEKIKWTYCWGTSILLLVAVLTIRTITTLVIWAITTLIVILTCCASEECNDGGTVAGISFVLSLVLILIFHVVFWIICHCKDPEYMVYTIECGDNKTLLADFTPPDGQIDSVKWTYQGSTVPHENASGGTLECPSLTLTMVSLDQSGVYVCKISCNLGQMQKQKVFHFKLLVTPKKYEEKIGDSVRLLKFLKNCQQVRKVEWTHTNNTITTNSCFYTGGDTSNPVLKVNCFATSDSGLYHCRIESGQTPKWFSANLKIKEQQEVKVGERIVLLKKLGISADVRSVVWTHDKRSLGSESYCGYEGGTMECPSLTIPVVSAQNAGKYECILEMNQGEFRMYRVILEVIGGNLPRQLPPLRIASPGKVHPEVAT